MKKSMQRIERELSSRLRFLGLILFLLSAGALYYALFYTPIPSAIDDGVDTPQELILSAGTESLPPIDLTQNRRQKFYWTSALFASVAGLCFWVAKKKQ